MVSSVIIIIIITNRTQSTRAKKEVKSQNETKSHSRLLKSPDKVNQPSLTKIHSHKH